MTISYEHRTMTISILRHFDRATDEQRRHGLDWYDLAFTHCERIAWLHRRQIEPVAVALSHLSPRTRWAVALEATDRLVSGRSKPGQILTRNWLQAGLGLNAVDPMSTFSRAANKTRSFAQAIMGDPSAVVLDIWAARVAGVQERYIRTQGGYALTSDAFVRAARRRDVTPREMQAITWVEVRGEAA